MVPDMRSDLDLVPAYVAGRHIPNAITLSSNETVHGPLPSVAEAVSRAAAGANRYPDFASVRLRGTLASFLGCAPGNVAVGCGSVALCQQLVQALCAPGDEVLFGWRSFEAYPILSRVAHAVPVRIPTLGDGRLDLDGLVGAVTERTRLIFLCTPNNPTGPALNRSELSSFLDRIPERVTVALDEAYVEYVRMDDAIDGVAEALARPNVVSVRTFSKAYGLAGIRVGYLIGSGELVAAVSKMAVPFSVSALAEAAAVASVHAGAELRERTEAVVTERERVRSALVSVGFRVAHSHANFLWLPLGEHSTAFDAHCLDHSVVLRCFPEAGVRLTIGTPEENDVALEVARSWRRSDAG